MKAIKWFNSKFIVSMTVFVAMGNLVGCSGGGAGSSGGGNAAGTTNSPAPSSTLGANSVSSNQFSTKLTYSIEYNGPQSLISANSQRAIRMFFTNNTPTDSNPLSLSDLIPNLVLNTATSTCGASNYILAASTSCYFDFTYTAPSVSSITDTGSITVNYTESSSQSTSLRSLVLNSDSNAGSNLGLRFKVYPGFYSYPQAIPTYQGLAGNTVNSIGTDGSNLYVATNAGLSISTDGGKTFISKTTADGLSDNYIYKMLVNGSNIYLATTKGFSVSNDGGKTFINTNNGATLITGLTPNVAYRDVIQQGSNIYLNGIYKNTIINSITKRSRTYTYNVIYKSTDLTGTAFTIFKQFDASPSLSNILYVPSWDTWLKGLRNDSTFEGYSNMDSIGNTTDTSTFSMSVSGMTMAPSSQSYLYAPGIYNSPQIRNPNGSYSSYSTSGLSIFKMNPELGSSSHLVTITSGIITSGIVKQDINGPETMNGLPQASPSSVVYVTDDYIYVGQIEGGLTTFRNTNDWSSSKLPSPPTYALTDSDVTSINIINSILYVGTNNGLYFSSDLTGTGSFTHITAPIFGTPNAYSANGVNIYIATTAGLAMSKDNGMTYTNKTFTNDNSTVKNILSVFSSTDGQRVYVGSNQGLFISADGGKTFTSPALKEYAISVSSVIASADGTHIYAATNYNGLYVSSDSGETFTNYTTPALANAYINDIAVYGTTIYIATRGGLSRASLDSSGNIISAFTNVLIGNNNIAKVFANNEGATVYALINAQGLFKSIDGGATFGTATTITGVTSYQNLFVSADGQNIYLATPKGLYKSTNSGINFNPPLTEADGLSNIDVKSVYVRGSTIFTGTVNGLSVMN